MKIAVLFVLLGVYFTYVSSQGLPTLCFKFNCEIITDCKKTPVECTGLTNTCYSNEGANILPLEGGCVTAATCLVLQKDNPLTKCCQGEGCDNQGL